MKRDADNQRYLICGAYILSPMSGGYWAINKGEQLVLAWVTAQDVRDYLQAN